MVSFEMQVVDTFRLANGVTAFSGTVYPDVAVIPECDCEILAEGNIRIPVHIDGEIILKKKQSPLRAITTQEPIDLSKYGLCGGGFTLRPKR